MPGGNGENLLLSSRSLLPPCTTQGFDFSSHVRRRRKQLKIHERRRKEGRLAMLRGRRRGKGFLLLTSTEEGGRRMDFNGDYRSFIGRAECRRRRKTKNGGGGGGWRKGGRRRRRRSVPRWCCLFFSFREGKTQPPSTKKRRRTPKVFCFWKRQKKKLEGICPWVAMKGDRYEEE